MTPRRHRETCRHVRAQLSDYVDGEIDAREATRLERHVRWCPNCRRMLANLTRTVDGLRTLKRERDGVAGPGEP